MPQSCLLPLLGLVASAQRVDDRHHHEAAWDHVDRACTVAIDAQKVTLRRTGDAAGPRLCAAELPEWRKAVILGGGNKKVAKVGKIYEEKESFQG